MSVETARAELRERLEAFYTSKRITELYLDPVRGSFDAKHLQEINRRIFQDLPTVFRDQLGPGFSDVKPGQFRSPAPAGQDWIKERKLDGLNLMSYVAYSPMDKASVKKLNSVLGKIDVAALSKMKTEPFVRAIGKLYAELDYLHPFPDGNSRTLREFTRELAEACGYNIDWNRFAASPGGRNVLYVARDLSVNELALPNLRSVETQRRVTFTQDQLAGNRNMPDLLKDAVLPGRAIAFRKLKERDALHAFPELAAAYHAMREAAAFGKKKFPNDGGKQRDFIEAVRTTILERLDAGETKNLRPAQKQEKAAKIEQERNRTGSKDDRER